MGETQHQWYSSKGCNCCSFSGSRRQSARWTGFYGVCFFCASRRGLSSEVGMVALEANQISNAIIDSDNKVVIHLCSTENVPPWDCGYSTSWVAQQKMLHSY
ncbi:hypothetical protein RHGRI_000746 [Rhododendron griersonianum]|uniref:Uncharacterized protein n=1 Tax=Rhododendron griersonianum TaxID=479676 RepID=A0AAV6LKA6_9ERIC|nr:hypothetical protein RHGRI_000746 [Rhododendron griersonianum]